MGILLHTATMAEQETNFRDLLQHIETVLYDAADVEPAAFLQTLQAAKPAFLNLLRYKASTLPPRLPAMSYSEAVPLPEATTA